MNCLGTPAPDAPRPTMADTSAAPAQFGVPWMIVALLVGVTGGGVGGGFLRPPAPAPAPQAKPSELTESRLEQLEVDVSELELEVDDLTAAQAKSQEMVRHMSRSVGWLVIQTQKTTVAIGAIAAAQDVTVDLFVAPLVDP